MFYFVNANFIIPILKKYNDFDEAIQELQYHTICRNSDYNSKVYVVDEEDESKIYTSNSNDIYSINLINGISKKIFSNTQMKYNNNSFWSKYRTNDLIDHDSNETEYEQKTNYDLLNNMKLSINEKKNSTVKFEDNLIISNSNDIKEHNLNQSKTKESTENVENVENEKKKQKIVKMIDEVNKLYQNEILKIKKLELNLKTYDNKLKKLEKEKKDKIINEIIRTQSEYRTWKKIKYGIKDDNNIDEIFKPIEQLEESNDIVPILFLSKYNYIEKIQKNESIGKLLDKINNLDLNELYSNSTLPEENILQFCNKYMKLSEELHYHFDDHEWSYLENEMNLSSTNKLSSDYISKKTVSQ